MERIARETDRMELLAEIAAFVREHGDILARYHTYTPDDLERIEQERCRLQEEACRRGACGTAGELVELEYLIARATAMQAKGMEEGNAPR
ncbi:hypothetical protein FGU65_11590 [Methanoculleus sp. FWC-SCC1]|uniref:Uncharacterized protein n=1 Tax=Methanoculleus frigidifontis TaxID=2584085 RepID=A0ABT8MC70_9EURY|nr:hypothetical protein [Methanoculleus sp. FWC-SCC1]MDN7025523.1 hypothetical protein [Methanoculleus sp. FWC-SCC1]